MSALGGLIFDRLLKASAPVYADDSQTAGAREMTEQYQIDHYNAANNTAFKNAADVNAHSGKQPDDYDYIAGSKWLNPKTGEDVTEMVTNGGDSTLPYKKPTFFQRFANPEGSDRATIADNEYTTNPAFAKQKNDIQNSIAGDNFQKVLDAQDTPVNKQPGSIAALSTQHMPEVERAVQSQTNVQKGLPSSNTITALAGNDALTAASENRAYQERARKAAGNIDLGVESENTGLKSNILGDKRLIANAPALDTKMRLGLGNDINRLETVEPKRTQLESGELDASLANLPEQNKLTRINILNQLNDANQKGEIAPDVYAAQKAKVKSDAAMSAQELKDIQEYINTAHNKAKLGAMQSGDEIQRYPAQKTIADVGAKLGAATAEQQYSDLPLELTKMHKQAQIGALTSAKDFGSIIADRTLGGKYGLDKIANSGGGVITLPSGKTVKVNGGGSSTNAPSTVTTPAIAAPLQRTPITNDVSPTTEHTQKEAVQEAKELKKNIATAMAQFAPKDFSAIKELPEDKFTPPNIQDNTIFGASRESQARRYLRKTLGDNNAKKHGIWAGVSAIDPSNLAALYKQALSSEGVDGIQDPKKLKAIREMIEELQGQTEHHTDRPY